MEMMGLRVAAEETVDFFADDSHQHKPSCIVIYSDNTGAIGRIFQGKAGKAQEHPNPSGNQPAHSWMRERT
jgi:hypothetical protein